MSHTIRLRGPWEYEWTVGSASHRGELRLPAAFPVIVFPATVGLGTTRAMLSLVRRFANTAGLENAFRIELVVRGESRPRAVYLNTAALSDWQEASPAESRCNITGRLNQRNELRLEFSLSQFPADSPPQDIPDCALEIFDRPESR